MGAYDEPPAAWRKTLQPEMISLCYGSLIEYLKEFGEVRLSDGTLVIVWPKKRK